ncbi:MAG: hypothetical protein ACPL4N_00705 [Candidatus Norongarragalinales archaeon]
MNSDDLSTLLIGFLLLVFILVELHGFGGSDAFYGGFYALILAVGLVIAGLFGLTVSALGGIIAFGLPGLIAAIALVLLARKLLESFTAGNFLAVIAVIAVLLLLI